MSVLSADVMPLSGRQGVVTAIIGGRKVTLVEITSLTARIEFNKTEYRRMGDSATQEKYTGWKGSGSLEYHWLSPHFVKMAIDVTKSGVMPYFSITAENVDPASPLVGRQNIMLGRVSIDGADIINLDIDNDSLSGSLDFTFSECEGLEYFNEPTDVK